MHCRYTFDHKESHLISDVLACHLDKTWSDTIVWIVRNGSGGEEEALVLECLGGEVEAKALKARFTDSSSNKRTKPPLKKKPEGNVVARSVEALFSRGASKSANKSAALADKPAALPPKPPTVHSQV